MLASNPNKSSRLSPSPSTPAHHGSKLPKFLLKQGRDRSKSVTDQLQPSGSTSSSVASSSSSSSSSPSADAPAPKHGPDSRRASKLKGVKESREEIALDNDRDAGEESVDEPPVIIEPVSPPPRARTRSERPLSASASDSHPAVSYYPSSSSQRFSDLPTRLSGWLSHTFSSSSTDLSLPSLLSQASLSSSPKTKASGLLTAAKHGKGHLDKAVRYLLDSDATPDKCAEPIWLLGVQHTGYEPPPPQPSPTSAGSGRRSSSEFKRSGSSFRPASRAAAAAGGDAAPSSRHPGAHWPPAFYADFTSRVWLTYRSHFPPIRDQPLAALEAEPAAPPPPPPPAGASPPARRWNWPGAGEKGWTSDAGWGCMLRTGQSLLANALVHLHLGRDWRRPPAPVSSADYAAYVRILSWFLDSPDPLCPFSVHRMALAGKELGKDVGQWFGPSTAAGAIKALVHAFPEAGLGVSVATDGVLYETDVLAASNAHPYPYRYSRVGSPRRQHASPMWGQRPVLLLIGIRLGIDGVNPVYYDSIKALYTIPQSVGIAGGRPSSSYYFVGTQADSLFYLDPHHARPAIPLRPPPGAGAGPGSPGADSPPGSVRDRLSVLEYSSDRESTRRRYAAPARPASSPASAPLPLPLPMQKAASSSQASWVSRATPSPTPSSAPGSPATPAWVLAGAGAGAGELDAVQEHLVGAYAPDELRTFHCERVRKMPLSGLDPSMLLGFLCRDERDWKDLRARVAELSRRYKTIFTIQDEPPTWPSDSDDMGLESVSDVDADLEFDEPDAFADAHEDARAARVSEEAETEDEPADPVTPGSGMGPGAFVPGAFVVRDEDADAGGAGDDGDGDEDGDEDGWVDPALPTPLAAPRAAAPAQEYYPFPVVDDREDDDAPRAAADARRRAVRGPGKERAEGVPRVMRAARARDGGRTQSGGVRGIVTSDADDGDDF